MARQGILEGAAKTALDLAGVIPVGIVHTLVPKGGAIDTYLTENKTAVRRVVGAGVLAAGIGYAALD